MFVCVNLHILTLRFAGSELCFTGKVGRSEADAGKAGNAASCVQKHVQADGQSAEQDALLQGDSRF